MTRRSSSEIGEDLRSWLSAHRMSGQAMADAINARFRGEKPVTQSWISRICNGRFKRGSRQAAKVLAYANIPIEGHVVIDPAGQSIIKAAVEEVWDGSTEGARAIASMLRSAGMLAARRRDTPN